MKYMEVIDDIDLDISRRINLNQGIMYQILPLYEKDNKVYVAFSKRTKEGEELLKFLFRSELCYIMFSSEEVELLINIILDYKYKEIEETVMKSAIFKNASDIHFEPTYTGLNIRFRINGDLILVKKIKLNEYEKLLSRLKLKGKMDITEKRKPQDGEMLFLVESKNYNCRLSTIPVSYGEKLVIRIMYENKYKAQLSELNFSKNQIKNIKSIINKRNGLIIINGPTGSGKSSTLYTILNYLSSQGKGINITTIEDPVEVQVKNINQMSLNEKMGITFKEGLKHIMRQDPDVIMVGEIRDTETAMIAVRAALTGHLVLSTLHSSDGYEVYLRLQEMGVLEYLLRDALVGIISQRLIKVLCTECKGQDEVKIIEGKETHVYKRNGCKLCSGTGYVKRSLVSAVHYIDKDFKKKINEENNLEELLSNKEMKLTLNYLIKTGDIDYEQYIDFLIGEEL